jgi:lipopolysaccharide transport system permease protein
MPSPLKIAFSDVRAGLAMHRVWRALAQEDIGDQHRRTTLGPLWLLLNYLCFAGTFIFVFHRGDTNMGNYPAYVATGLLIWFYMMEVITGSVSLFVREESLIKGTTLPLSVYVMRLTMQSIIRAGYAFIGCLAILAMSGVNVSIGWIWSLVAFFLIAVVTPAVVIIFAFLGSFFPDSQYIVSNIMRIGMFLTPVFWTYDKSGGLRHAFYYFNPFTYFLEIVRVPTLSGEMPMRSLLLCVMIGLCTWLLSLFLLGRYSRQVVFVL